MVTVGNISPKTSKGMHHGFVNWTNLIIVIYVAGNLKRKSQEFGSLIISLFCFDLCAAVCANCYKHTHCTPCLVLWPVAVKMNRTFNIVAISIRAWIIWWEPSCCLTVQVSGWYVRTCPDCRVALLTILQYEQPSLALLSAANIWHASVDHSDFVSKWLSFI